MTDTKPFLLLPGPLSVEAAQSYFGTAYEYLSYLTDEFAIEGATYITNGALKPLAGRRVDFWFIPPRFRRGGELAPGMESILRQLVKLKCTIRVVSMTEDDEQYTPHLCRLVDVERDALLAWARQHIHPLEDFPDDVPRETAVTVTRGRPRTQRDGGNPNGEEIDGATGSAFVSWERLGLELTSSGIPHPHLANIQRILANHPALIGRIWYDEFHEKVFQTLFQAEPAEWQDTHDTRLTVWIQRNLRLHKVAHGLVQRAVDDYARLNTHNEVREWMEALQWDHRERLPQLFHRAFGADDTEYHQQVGRCWMTSMAARTFEPGCKVDTLPVFEGSEGVRKSTALKIIGGKWFAEMHEDVTSKDFLQGLRGNLLIEISELHAFNRAEIRKIKGIVSCAVDRYRESYGRRATNHARRGVWAGTTNESDWNTSDTGARRFWPVRCGRIDLDYLQRYREQLFAEAVFRFKAGEPWWDIDPVLAREQQDARLDHDEWTGQILSYCALRYEVTVGEILQDVISIPLKDMGKSEQMRVASILKRAGYERRTLWRGNRAVKAWLTRKMEVGGVE